MMVEAFSKALEECAGDFAPEQLTAARSYLAEALKCETNKHHALLRANVVLAALSLGGDVWQPKSDSQKLRHDLRTYADQLAGLNYTAKGRKRR